MSEFAAASRADWSSKLSSERNAEFINSKTTFFFYTSQLGKKSIRAIILFYTFSLDWINLFHFIPYGGKERT